MITMTIKARLLALPTLVILLFSGLGLFLRSEVVRGQTAMETSRLTLKEMNITLQDSHQTLSTLSAVLQKANAALKGENQLLTGLTR